MMDRAVLMVNEDWRIASDDDLQWILQYRKVTKGQTLWIGRSFHMERDSLLRRLPELAKPIELAGAVAVVASWPPHFSEWLQTVENRQEAA